MEAAVVGMLLGARSEWRRTLLEWALEKRRLQFLALTTNPAVRIVDLQVAAEQRKEHSSKDEEHSKDDMSRNSVMLKKYKFRAPKANYDHGQFQWRETLGLGTYSKVMKATLKETGAVYALKIMNKVQIFEEQKTKSGFLSFVQAG